MKFGSKNKIVVYMKKLINFLIVVVSVVDDYKLWNYVLSDFE